MDKLDRWTNCTDGYNNLRLQFGVIYLNACSFGTLLIKSIVFHQKNRTPEMLFLFFGEHD